MILERGKKMAFNKHIFRDGNRLTARELNEAEDQIAQNEQNIPISAEYSEGTLTFKGILGNLFSISGLYKKPSSGIPKSDLSQDVQNALNGGSGGSGGGGAFNVPVNEGDSIGYKVYPFPTFVTPSEFVSPNDTDDTNSINRAIQYAVENKMVVFLNKKNYVTSSPIILRRGTSLYGTQTAKRHDGSPRITNQTTAMFDTVPDSDRNLFYVNICGVSFQGNTSNLSKSGNILFDPSSYTNFFGGGLKNVGIYGYDKIVGDNVRLTDVTWDDIEILGVNELGTFIGSDCLFRNWNVGGGSAIRRASYFVTIETQLSRWEDLYFTGYLSGTGYGPQNIAKLTGSANVISGCWFDYVDGAGLYVESYARRNVIRDNLFRGCGRVSTDGYLVCAGANNEINGNTFENVHTGNEVSNSVPCVKLTTASSGNYIPFVMCANDSRAKISDSGSGNITGTGSGGGLTSAEVTNMINSALGVIENGSY